MFDAWDNFYLLIGSAAAALIGLLFVVATLTSNLEQSEVLRGARIYMTPTVFHFAVVLILSGMALAPHMPPPADGTITAVLALAGLAYGATVAVRIHTGESPAPAHWSDVWFYGAAPSVIYLALGATAAALFTAVEAGPYTLAAVLLALLLVSIRNAWDLVTYLAPLKPADTKTVDESLIP
jgi:hypothetical protein